MYYLVSVFCKEQFIASVDQNTFPTYIQVVNCHYVDPADKLIDSLPEELFCQMMVKSAANLQKPLGNLRERLNLVEGGRSNLL